jgi:D-threo-aldose 1-dehydrogenase
MPMASPILGESFPAVSFPEGVDAMAPVQQTSLEMWGVTVEGVPTYRPFRTDNSRAADRATFSDTHGGPNNCTMPIDLRSSSPVRPIPHRRGSRPDRAMLMAAGEQVLPKRRLGRTPVEVTELGFGGTALGNMYEAVGDEDAYAAIEKAWQGGIRYFDTAPHYGLGLSERRLGAGLAGKPRDEYVVSTKVGRLLVPNPAPKGSDLSEGGYDVPDDLMRVWDFSRDGVMRSIEASLERLGLDRIDVALVHDPDDHLDQAINEAIPALVELREQGVIGAVGAGMNFVSPLARIAAESDVDALLVAGRWTLIDRSAGSLLDFCYDRGIAILAAAPFNSELLATSWPEDGARFDYTEASASVLATARKMAELCAAQEMQMPHAALRFPFRHDAVTSVICGMRNAREVEIDLEWASTALSADLWRAIDAQTATLLGDDA